MYNIRIKNGLVDHNQTCAQTGYLQEDITDGVFTKLSNVPNLRDVKLLIATCRDAERKERKYAMTHAMTPRDELDYFNVRVYKTEEVKSLRLDSCK